MRRLRKITVLASASALVLAGCGGGSSDGDGDNESGAGESVCDSADGDGPKIGLAYDVGGRGDQSFNDSAYAGLEQAVDATDATCIEAEAGTGEDDAARSDRLRTLADQGYNPIIAVGFIYSPSAAEVAAEYPDVDFAVIDGYATSVASDLDNLADLVFAENEGSFLVGVAAALKTQTNTVGFVGGASSDLIKKFEAGYIAGVEAVDPTITVEIQYLTDDPTDGQTAFENPQGGRTAAEGQLDAGADIVYHAAGKSGLGVFEAVTDAGDGIWAIGVDSDQYLTADESQQPHILTSMLKRIDTSVLEYVTAFDEGETLSGTITYDLAVDGVGYSTSGGFVDDIAPQIDEFATQIKDGSLTVPTAP